MYTYLLNPDFSVKEKILHDAWKYNQKQKSDMRYYWNRKKCKSGDLPLFRIQKAINNELITLIEYHIRY